MLSVAGGLKVLSLTDLPPVSYKPRKRALTSCVKGTNCSKSSMILKSTQTLRNKAMLRCRRKNIQRREGSYQPNECCSLTCIFCMMQINLTQRVCTLCKNEKNDKSEAISLHRREAENTGTAYFSKKTRIHDKKYLKSTCKREMCQDYSCCKIVKEQEDNLLFNFPLSSSAQEKKLCGSCCLTPYSLPVSVSCSVVGDKELQQTTDNSALSISRVFYPLQVTKEPG